MIPGQRFSLEVILPPLLDVSSSFQHIQIYDSKSFGKILLLDGVVQLTERDEFAYHEMIAHVPLFSFPPSLTSLNVLLIGAGDGGALREILKHDSVGHVVHIEIDRVVVESCQRFLPNVSNGAFEDSRVELIIADGLEYLKTLDNATKFDLCIVDSSDPSEGPNGTLYQPEFYSLVKSRLDPNHGLMCFQSEHQWMHVEFIHTLKTRCEALFPRTAYFYTQVPSYPGGQIGFLLCGVDPNWKHVLRPVSFVESLRYYSAEVHQASFVLPRWIQCRLANNEE